MNLHLAWSTETSNSYDLLREFVDHLETKHLSITLCQQLTNDVILAEGVWIFFISTTGQGQFPTKSRGFWQRLLRKNAELPKPFMFSIYALGDSSYGDDYNMAGRKLRQRLKMLGGQEFLEIGLGDQIDTQGYRQTYLKTWRDQATNFLIKQIKVSDQKFKYSPQHKQDIKSLGRIKNVQQLSSEPMRKVYWVQVELREDCKPRQGDVLEICPYNREQDVQFLLKYFKLDETQLTWYQGGQVQVGRLFRQILNISSTLNHYFFTNSKISILRQSLKNELHRQKILQFHSTYDQYYEYIKKYKRNLIQFLKDFQGNLPLLYLLEHLNYVVPRKFSIARIEGNTVYLLVKAVETEITPARIHKGLCSNDIINATNKQRKVNLIKGVFSQDLISNANIVVSLGIGIAPFIWLIDKIIAGSKRCLLFYASRYSSELYHQKLIENSSKIEEVISISNQGGAKIAKVLADHKEQIKQLIKQCGTKDIRVFYCGPRSIHDYLLDLFEQLTGDSKQQLLKSKRIIYQNW